MEKAKLQGEIEALNTEKMQAERVVADLHKQNTIAEQHLDKVTKEYTEKSEEITKLNAEIVTLSAEKETISQEISRIEKGTENCKANALTEKQEALADLATVKENTSKEKLALEQELAEKRAELDAVNAEITAKVETRKQVDAGIAKAKEALADYESRAELAEQRCTDAEVMHKTKNDAFAGINVQIDSAKNDLTAITAEIAGKEEVSKSLDIEIKSKQEEVKTAVTTLSNIQANKEALAKKEQFIQKKYADIGIAYND